VDVVKLAARIARWCQDEKHIHRPDYILNMVANGIKTAVASTGGMRHVTNVARASIGTLFAYRANLPPQSWSHLADLLASSMVPLPAIYAVANVELDDSLLLADKALFMGFGDWVQYPALKRVAGDVTDAIDDALAARALSAPHTGSVGDAPPPQMVMQLAPPPAHVHAHPMLYHHQQSGASSTAAPMAAFQSAATGGQKRPRDAANVLDPSLLAKQSRGANV